MKNQWVCILGSHPQLTSVELFSLLRIQNCAYTILEYTHPVVVLEISGDFNPTSLLHESGGVIKIARIVADDIKFETLEAQLAAHIQSQKLRDIGISNYTSHGLALDPILVRVKKQIQERGEKLRYVSSRNEQFLSSIVVAKQDITELMLAPCADKIVLAQTVAVQNSDDWGKRDYNRPFADPKRGMLPPKVARMMVNIARALCPKQSHALLDPFCGMATVLAEGMMVGVSGVGSDNDTTVAKRAQANLEWIGKEYEHAQDISFRIMTADSTHIDEMLASASVGMIVTEPFMGIPFELVNGQLTHKKKPVELESVKNMVKGLEKLYIGSLKSWRHLLVPNGVVVMTLPQIELPRGNFTVKKVLDSIENLGYTLYTGPLPYSRPQTVVTRQIYVFIRKD